MRRLLNPAAQEANVLNLLTEQDVAKHLHVSVGSLRRWRAERKGPQFIKVGPLVRYRPDDVEEWLRSRPIGGETRRPGETAPGAGNGTAA